MPVSKITIKETMRLVSGLDEEEGKIIGNWQDFVADYIHTIGKTEYEIIGQKEGDNKS